MSRHGRRHHQRGHKKFDVAATPVTPPAPTPDEMDASNAAASTPSAEGNDD
jgi:hypothetical protein